MLREKSGAYRLLLAVFAVIFLLAGCSASKMDSEAAPAAQEVGGMSDSVSGETAGSGGDSVKLTFSESDAAAPAASAGVTSTSNISASAVNQKLIYKAELYLQVKDFESAQAEFRARVAEAGGYILQFSEEDNGGRRSGQLTAKIPAQGLSPFLDQIDRIPAENRQRSVQGDDVSEEYVDLEARLKAKELVEERLLTFLSEATKTDDLVSFSTELGKVQEDIERYKGRMRYIDENVAMSTVSLRLTEKAEAFPSVRREGLWGGMSSAFSSSLHALNVIAQGLLIFIVRILPFAVVLGVIALAALPARRVWLRKKVLVPVPMAPAAPIRPEAGTITQASETAKKESGEEE